MAKIKNKVELDAALLKGSNEYLGKEIKILKTAGNDKEYEATITEVSLRPSDNYYNHRWVSAIPSIKTGAGSLRYIRDLAFDEQLSIQRTQAQQNKVENDERTEKVDIDQLIEKLDLKLVFFAKPKEVQEASIKILSIEEFELH